MEKNKEIEEIWKKKLMEMGFKENPDKPNLWFKNIDGGYAHWDFRKVSKGRYYLSMDGSGIQSGEQIKTDPEYIALRNIQEKTNTENKDEKQTMNVKPKNIVVIENRGNEETIEKIVNSMRLEMIVRASKSKNNPGEGILYHDLGSIGLEPSAELVDMITVDMGDIKTEIIEQGIRTHIDIKTGNEYNTQYAIVKATDMKKGTTGLGSAEELMDFREMEKNNRSFALTKAIRKAERNAKERLIPVPRRAMVELVKELLNQYLKHKK